MTPRPTTNSAARTPVPATRRLRARIWGSWGSDTTSARGSSNPAYAQLHALRQIVCRLLVHHYGELIAYGAGWTDPERQQPVGDSGRHEPAAAEAIVDAELRARTRRHPTRSAGSRNSPPGSAPHSPSIPLASRTKALGTERIARKLRDALPGGERSLRTAVWEFMRPMLSPGLAAVNHDVLVLDDTYATTVDLATHRAASSLDDLDLDLDELDSAAA